MKKTTEETLKMVVSEVICVVMVMLGLTIIGLTVVVAVVGKSNATVNAFVDQLGFVLLVGVIISMVATIGIVIGLIVVGILRVLKFVLKPIGRIMWTATATTWWPQYDTLEIESKERRVTWGIVTACITFATMIGGKLATGYNSQWLEAGIIGGVVCIAMFSALFFLWAHCLKQCADKRLAKMGA